MRPAERGALLLEVVAALAILALVAPAMLALVAAVARQERLAATREEQVAQAERVLGALTLLTRAELDRGVGVRRMGEFVVEIERPQPALYRLSVSRADTRRRAELVTMVYRPGAAAP